jgi:predicted phage baseplate assembly protein
VQLPLPGADELRLWSNLEPQEQGVGEFPPSLEEADVEDRIITWIRIRLPKAQEEQQSSQFDTRLSWVGINVARVEQYAHVSNEVVGRGSGEPDQTLSLANTPVLKRSVQLTVNGEPWQEIDDLLAAGAEVTVRNRNALPGAVAPTREPSKVYTLDRESGEIRFGTGIHGMRPPAGATIGASYNYGGGRQGIVGIGAVNKGPLLPAGVKVTNPLPTWGGDEAESVADGERRIPAYLRHQDRAVSNQDFKDIVWRTPGVDLGRVEVLPLFHPTIAGTAAGVLTLIVIPAFDPVQPEAPQPDRLFLDAICRHVNPRRLVTTEVHVRGPIYEPVWVSVGIDVVPGKDVAPVQEAVKNEIRVFLSPLTGGFDGGGWPLNTPVDRLELWAVAARVEGVSRVKDLLLGDSSGEARPRIELTGLQLPRLLGVGVQPGDPTPLAALRGDLSPEEDDETDKRLLPIPVVPEEC